VVVITVTTVGERVVSPPGPPQGVVVQRFAMVGDGLERLVGPRAGVAVGVGAVRRAEAVAVASSARKESIVSMLVKDQF
jgi:hypothetical protein